MKTQVLTDLYEFQKQAVFAKERLDSIRSTGKYPYFEERRKTQGKRQTDKRDKIVQGSLLVYCGGVPSGFGGDIHSKADLTLSMNGRNLSSVFVPNPKARVGFGDVNGTDDAILVLFSEDFAMPNGQIRRAERLTIIIARGQRRNRRALYNAFIGGELDEEIAALYNSAQYEENAEILVK